MTNGDLQATKAAWSRPSESAESLSTEKPARLNVGEEAGAKMEAFHA